MRVLSHIYLGEKFLLVIDFSLGEGGQTFKWLAMAIESRIREQKLLRKNFAQDSVVVLSIENTNGELFDPADRVYEHCISESLSVKVKVVEQLSTDDHGSPLSGEWRATAYTLSAPGCKWHEANESWRERLSKIRESKKALHLPSHKLIHIGEFDEREAGFAFDVDFASIDWFTLGIGTGDRQKKAIHDLLKEKYVIICNFFQHFVGTGRIGEKYGMTLHEFGRVLHLCRLLNYSSKESRELCNNLFFTFVKERLPQNDDIENVNGGEHPLLSRTNFVECLIKYSLDVWCNKNNSIKEIEGSKQSSGSNVNVQIVLSPIEILVEIICGHDNYRYSGTKSEETEGENERKEDSSQKTDIKSIIQTKCPEFKSMAVVWKELSTGYLAYDAENEKIQDVFLNFYHSVKEAFLLFTDDNAHITGGPTITLDAFESMLSKLDLTDESHHVIILNSFLSAQCTPVRSWELEELVFVEYFEALARVAIQVIDSDEFKPEQRIRLVFSTISDYQHHTHHK